MPAQKPAAPQKQRLSLTTTSLRNVIVSNKSDVIYYEIVTPKWARERTTISRLDPNTRQFDVVAEMHNDDHGKAADVVLYGATPRPVTQFLEGQDTDGSGAKRASFVGKDGRRYTWRINHRRLDLVREDMPDDQPVAVYHREKRHIGVLRMSQQPYLEIDPCALDTLDSLIMSFLLIERRRRDGKL